MWFFSPLPENYTVHDTKMASPSWSSRYKVGEFVEIFRDEEWILGVISEVQNRGYYEYSITLISDGSVVQEVARDMRKADVVLEELTLDEPALEAAVQPGPNPEKPEESKQKRFATVQGDDLDRMETSAKAAKTIAQTKWGVKIFRDWLIEVAEPPAFEELIPATLANLLRRFYAEVRTKTGLEYSKKSLLCIRAALHRHHTSSPFNVDYNIMSDVVFKQANTTLLGHIKGNKRAGLDQSTSYQAITEADKVKMYETGTLSNDNPTSLQLKVYYELALHFGRRAREGLHDLKKEHFVFKEDSNGVEYATLSFNALEKNHQGISDSEGEHQQRMYGTGEPNCPLRSLKMYLGKLSEHTSFFQTPKKKNFKLSNTWFAKSPVGVNTIGKFMATISAKAGLSRIYTNHYVRATCVTTLRDKGVPSKDIKAVTGHRNEASIDFYSKTPDKVREQMSLQLAGVEKKNETTLSQTNVLNVQNAAKGGPLFSNVQFENCTFNININN